MAEIDRIDRKSAIQLAKNMRKRVRNLTLDKKKAADQGMQTLVAVGAGAFSGHMMGSLEAEYRANQAAIDSGEAEDPRTVMGIDKDLALGIGLGGVAFLGLGGAKASKYLRAGADGILSGYAYNKMFSRGLEAAEEAA